jgi:hypothetical protein
VGEVQCLESKSQLNRGFLKSSLRIRLNFQISFCFDSPSDSGDKVLGMGTKRVRVLVNRGSASQCRVKTAGRVRHGTVQRGGRRQCLRSVAMGRT